MNLDDLPRVTREKIAALNLHGVTNLTLQYLRTDGRLPTRVELEALTRTMSRCRQLIDELGWGLWCHEQLEVVHVHAPKVLEVGAGIGFFGMIAQAYDLEVRLTEKSPVWRNRFYRQPLKWPVKVDQLTALQAMEEDPDVPVLLSWPPGELAYVGRVTALTMGMQVAKALPQGGRLLYLGDAAMVTAGGEGFSAQLAASFRELARVPGPRWAEPAAPEVLLVLEKL